MQLAQSMAGNPVDIDRTRPPIYMPPPMPPQQPPPVMVQRPMYVNAPPPQQQQGGMNPMGMASMARNFIPGASGAAGGGAAGGGAGFTGAGVHAGAGTGSGAVGFTGTGIHAGAGMGGGAAGAGGAGGASGATSALGSAGPWGLLAAAIIGNETYAKKHGYRREGSDYWRDLGSGKVLWQDIENRWGPKIFGNSTLGADSRGISQMMQGNVSEGWKTMKDEGPLKYLFNLFD